MCEVNSNLQESIIDLKSRSMRGNLVFSGIHEERGENTEEILQEFIKRKFRIDDDVWFDGCIAWESGLSITTPQEHYGKVHLLQRGRADPDACPSEMCGSTSNSRHRLRKGEETLPDHEIRKEGWKACAINQRVVIRQRRVIWPRKGRIQPVWTPALLPSSKHW